MERVAFPPPERSRPRVSVIVPAHSSDGTLPACLRAIAAQSFTDFELIVVDSTPGVVAPGAGDALASILDRVPGRARYLCSPVPLGAHAARNVGASHAAGDLFVFTDPDIYPEPGWLASLVAAHDASAAVVFGPIACEGRRWFDTGVHLCKFAICLPEAGVRSVEYGWSGNMLCARDVFERVGPFPEDAWHGDTILSARLRAAGERLSFAPGAVVRHDHEGTRAGRFLRERFQRGAELAVVSADGSLTGVPWTRAERLRRVVTSVFWPVKVARACLQVAAAASRSGQTIDVWRVWPVIVAGQTAWVLGASFRYVSDGFSRRHARPYRPTAAPRSGPP